MWAKLRNIKVGERNPTKEQYCVILLVRRAQSGCIHRDRKLNGGDRGLEEELVFGGYRASVCGDENVLEIVVVVAHH